MTEDNLGDVVVLHDAVSPSEIRRLNGQLRAKAAVLIRESDARAREAARKIYAMRANNYYDPALGEFLPM